MKKIPLKIKLIIALIALTGLPFFTCRGQTNTNTNVSPFGTNDLSGIPTNSFAPVSALLGVLPNWNPALTNTFGSGEFLFSVAPLWKSQFASGTTPLLSTSGSYYFTRNIGGMAEVVTLGNGAGNSTVDSASALLLVRRDVGNIALYGMAGGGRDFGLSRFGGEIGGGFEYRYATRIGLYVDTRGFISGHESTQNGWMTRVGLNLAF